MTSVDIRSHRSQSIQTSVPRQTNEGCHRVLGELSTVRNDRLTNTHLFILLTTMDKATTITAILTTTQSSTTIQKTICWWWWWWFSDNDDDDDDDGDGDGGGGGGDDDDDEDNVNNSETTGLVISIAVLVTLGQILHVYIGLKGEYQT